MIYSESGLAENNRIFTTDFPDRGQGTWVLARYEPEAFRVEYVVSHTDRFVEKIDLVLAEGVFVNAIACKIGPAMVISKDDEEVGTLGCVYGPAEGTEHAADNQRLEDILHGDPSKFDHMANMVGRW